MFLLIPLIVLDFLLILSRVNLWPLVTWFLIVKIMYRYDGVVFYFHLSWVIPSIWMTSFLTLAAIRYKECNHESSPWRKLRHAFIFHPPAPDLSFIFDVNSSTATKYKRACALLLSNQFKNPPPGRLTNAISGKCSPISELKI